MSYSKDYFDEGQEAICYHVQSRLAMLNGQDKSALYAEFKEWLVQAEDSHDEIWSIPDLTDEGLCDFFKRAISQK